MREEAGQAYHFISNLNLDERVPKNHPLYASGIKTTNH